MGSIREVIKKDGSKSYHAEVRIRGAASQRASFRNSSLAKKWIQKIEAAIRDGKYFPDAESRRHTIGETIDRFIGEWLPRFPKRLKKQKALLSRKNKAFLTETVSRLPVAPRFLSDTGSSDFGDCLDIVLPVSLSGNRSLI